MSINYFEDLKLSDEVQRGVAEIGFTEATSIQSESIPLILEGHDFIGQSQTGSGKTAAFGLPSIDLIEADIDRKTPQVLILSPTRELALQSADEITKFSKYKPFINTVAIYGGEAIERQITRMRRGCQIVVGTPGRIMDHMRRKTLDLRNLKIVILDEADEMLNMGFVEDIETILSSAPEERQTILFSATMSPEIMEIAKKFQKDPQIVNIKKDQLTVDTIEQYYFDVPRGRKVDALYCLLEYYQPKMTLIFCNTKKMVDELVNELGSLGYPSQGLHGDMKQGQRTAVMNGYKDAKFGTLIATDVAARGIDVNDIDLVVNFDLPQEDEYYVHRIGRTGRAGKTGIAITLTQGGRQISQLKNIMRFTRCKITEKQLPTPEQIAEIRMSKASAKIMNFMVKNNVQEYYRVVEKMISDDYTLMDVAAAMFALSMNTTPKIKSFASSKKEPAMKTGRIDREKTRNRQLTGSRKKSYDDSNMELITLTVGKKHRVSVNQIVGAIAGESGVPGKSLGAIQIGQDQSVVAVPREHKKTIIKSLKKATINGRTFKVNG